MHRSSSTVTVRPYLNAPRMVAAALARRPNRSGSSSMKQRSWRKRGTAM
jgi:hypothetical protein